tara:strand:+ start:61 stop:1092 length:1032 start_codon:yes stop_codon:yes gene_type:complete
MNSSEQYKEYNNKGLTGLSNMGNTCFMNSTLQCLSHTYELNNFLNRETYKNKLNRIPESLVLWEWDNLRKLMWSENCIIQPAGFLQAIHKVSKIKGYLLFSGFQQNDLTEFLVFCINCFHNSIKRDVNMTISGNVKTKQDKIALKCYNMMKSMYMDEYSEIIDMFYGIQVSNVKSLESSYNNITTEPILCLNLEIGKKKTLEGCIEKYTMEETLDMKIEVDEKNKKKESATKKISFWSLPNNLIIVLKRFTNDNKKNKEMIDFPINNLDLTKYIIGYDKKSYKYELYGICNHSGGTLGGHYTAYVKNANNKWYLYNDTNVSEVKNLAKLKSVYAYCFFYRKKK